MPALLLLSSPTSFTITSSMRSFLFTAVALSVALVNATTITSDSVVAKDQVELLLRLYCHKLSCFVRPLTISSLFVIFPLSYSRLMTCHDTGSWSLRLCRRLKTSRCWIQSPLDRSCMSFSSFDSIDQAQLVAGQRCSQFGIWYRSLSEPDQQRLTRSTVNVARLQNQIPAEFNWN